MPATQPARVLVVDDNVDSAESLAMLLQFSGHETSVAHDGPEAIETAERFRPDVILLDLGLPNLGGLEVCRELRKRPWAETVAILALTGWGRQDDQRRSLDAGFTGHLVKPVDFGELQSLVESLLRNRQPHT